MAIITFISDFGYSDHYVAAVKASILSENAALTIIDISHDIERFNLAHGSHVLNSVFRDFPKGTVHIVGVDSVHSATPEYIALRLEDHFFIGSDNGLFGLISIEDAQEVVSLSRKMISSFPAKDIFGPAAAALATGKQLKDVGTPRDHYYRMLGRQLRATKKQISGHVLHIDHYGNLITNIDRNVFEILNKSNSFTVMFGRERIQQLHESYNCAENGDCLVFFNNAGLLEIGINKGSAAQLLGLQYDSPVNIIFHHDA